MFNRQLNTFIKAAECGSFSKAAEVLYITPSAVIQQINSLEDCFDIKLFVRSNQGIRLTAAGDYLLTETKMLIARNERIRTHLMEMKHGERQVISVGINNYHQPKLLYELWFHFDIRYPNYQVKTVSFGDTVPTRLTGIDLVEGIYFHEAWQRDYDFIHCSDVPMSIALPHNHPLVGGNNAHLC